jgi:hypothetical protein
MGDPAPTSRLYTSGKSPDTLHQGDSDLKQLSPVFLLFTIALPTIGLAQDQYQTQDQDQTQDQAQAQTYTPMTSSQRWNDYISGSLFSPGVAFSSLASAAISHVSKDPVQWGQSSRGYFERVGSHWARSAVEGSIHSSLAAALGHDTRYFREPEKTGWQRTRHALRRTFVTQNRAGHAVFDVSQMAGLYGAPMASSLWNPNRHGAFKQGVRAGTFGIGMQAGSNLFKEFGPDLKRAILGK